MTTQSAFTCTPRQARRHIVRCLQAGLVPFLKSSPAMGKSAIVKSIAQEFGLELLDTRLSTCTAEDLQGLPQLNKDTARFIPFENFPTEDTNIPSGKEGWLIFLDEFNSADKRTMAAAYKLLLDRMTGLRKLHSKALIVCAGNLTTDRAIVNPIGTALQSRVVTLELTLDFDEFMEDVAYPQKWDGRIIAYLNYKKSHLHDFKPDHNENTFCAPRTWEFMNRLIQGHEIRDEDAPLYAGTITSGVATDFITFTKFAADCPKIADILRDPEGTPLPTTQGIRFSTVTHLAEYAEDGNLGPIVTYVLRLPTEFQVVFFRMLRARKPELRVHPEFRKALVLLSRYLNDDQPIAA